MTIFWILAAGLMALAALFVVAPLIGGRIAGAGEPDIDQAHVNLSLFKQQLAELDADLAAGKLERTQYEAARRDLERELLRDTADLGPADPRPAADVKLPGPRLTAAALLFAVPVTALVLYLILGERQIIPRLDLAAAGADTQQHAGGPAGMPSLEVLVARLEERLRQVPDDGEGWTMLGRTYFATGRVKDAERALARAHELLPEDTQVTLAYAETIAANNDSSLEGKPAALISEALAAEPDNATARWLSGMVAFQRGQFQSAATAWKGVLAQVDPAGKDAAELKRLIAQAEQRAGIPAEMQLAAGSGGTGVMSGGASAQASAGEPGAAAAADASSAAAAQTPGVIAAEPTDAKPAAAGGVDVTVSLAPALAGRMPPDTTVFVFARAASGPPMPLAVQRLTLADLPASMRLDDSMAMMPQMRLSAFPQVMVGARVSPGGQAIPQSGDLEGETGPVSSTGAGAVSVTIDRVHP
jgi:cytochrome c-type biogenesis protein CcmH